MKLPILFTIFVLHAILVFSQTKEIDSVILKRHNANLTYSLIYKENSELSYTSPVGEIGAPSKYIINGRLTTNYLVVASQSLPLAFSIIPDFTVRVRNERSAGVRTPSFKLGGSLFLRLSLHAHRYRYAELSFIHHSNGQDGEALLKDGSINTTDGNFNTNYLIAAYRFGYFTNRSINGDYAGFHHKVGFQWHKWFDYETALTGVYGFTRINYDLSFRIYHISKNKVEKEKWRFNGSVSYAINSLTNYAIFAPKRRLNSELSANYSFPFMQNVFLMATIGYYGEDPYNIYFKDKYAYARFGISSTFMRWKR
ncbi:hypothetical protein [Pedobacter insulae]|uniref:Phosphatidylcholine 1-acylhydrolase n=1 Tax=Pedobacter insulae TaxID=414048 RepID=A0A1I2USA4_9SPHI|nr:hypothetical protein [Pedobacter insulae]SFG79089.1 hypothetical protein SAMN04489864_102278 [Pedobacter insulae]